jgi:hypothetical protein
MGTDLPPAMDGKMAGRWGQKNGAGQNGEFNRERSEQHKRCLLVGFAKYAKAGWADCIRDDRLLKYIVDSKFGKGLTAEEVDSVARAFSSLARMDPDFSARAGVVADAKRATAGASALGEPARA